MEEKIGRSRRKSELEIIVFYFKFIPGEDPGSTA
jgi:hypothetical protein